MPLKDAIRRLIDSRPFQAGVIILILINALLLGIETLPGVSRETSTQIFAVDRAIIYLFVVEVLLRIYAAPTTYFRSGWNIFDFAIVVISVFAENSGLAAIRALRVLRVLRVVTVIPRMRLVVAALLDSIPGIASVGIVVVLIVYIFAVIGSNLYGAAHPEIFGDVFTSMYTLFQVMTLEGWADIASRVGTTHPHSWAYFLTFVLIATFTMLNLFVAIVVKTVDDEEDDPRYKLLIKQNEAVLAEIAALREEIARRN